MREMLAVVKALNAWRLYLLGHTFDLCYSDNQAVTLFETAIFDTATSLLGTTLLRVRFQPLSLTWKGQLCS